MLVKVVKRSIGDGTRRGKYVLFSECQWAVTMKNIATEAMLYIFQAVTMINMINIVTTLKSP
jgi:hypothetical protein